MVWSSAKAQVLAEVNDSIKPGGEFPGGKISFHFLYTRNWILSVGPFTTN